MINSREKSALKNYKTFFALCSKKKAAEEFNPNHSGKDSLKLKLGYTINKNRPNPVACRITGSINSGKAAGSEKSTGL